MVLPTVDCTGAHAQPLSHDAQRRLSIAVAGAALGQRALPDNPYAFVRVIDDAAALKQCLTLAKAYRAVDTVLLVGIGGSNLGTLAIDRALRGTYPARGPALVCLDTTDAGAMRYALARLSDAYRRKKRVLVVLVSKSGTTSETIANGQILLAKLATLDKRWQRSVVAITDQGSALWTEAATKGIAALAIPASLGGRYSVLSPVGLFPLAVLGHDVAGLVRGARAMRDRCLRMDATNPAAQLAATQYAADKELRTISEYFVFGSDMEYVGRWYRQLLGESVGKAETISGEQVNVGLTPTVLVGSTDLHSVGQLAFGGPHDKLTILVKPVSTTVAVRVPMRTPLALLPSLRGQSLQGLLSAVAEGTERTYHEARRPVVTITLPAMDAPSIGALLQLHMHAVVLLGALFAVNPFDQPAVESYKVHTRAVLERATSPKRRRKQ